MDNLNIDENTMNNIKKMVDNGNISDAVSQISPEMIQNFSKMLSSNKKENKSENDNNTNSGINNNIDMDTIMKISSMLGKVNNSNNDPRANLLNSLKPYLRDSRKGQIDNYMNLLNVAKIAEVMKEVNDKENKGNV